MNQQEKNFSAMEKNYFQMFTSNFFREVFFPIFTQNWVLGVCFIQTRSWRAPLKQKVL